MGDRANIYLVDTKDESHGIYLYTHWSGYRWPEALRGALEIGEARWGDEQYLARIITSDVFDDLRGCDTGGGISTTIGDNGRPIIVADLINSTVSFASEGSEGDRSKWKSITPFEEYIDTVPACYPQGTEDW